MSTDRTPAFPRPTGETETHKYPPIDGMELRDFFASKSLVGLLNHETQAAFNLLSRKMDTPISKLVAMAAYEYADAMMEARKT